MTSFVALFVTVTTHVSVWPPSSVVAVIVAVPTAFAVTSPVPSTVAISLLLDVQVTFLFVALVGYTTAVSCFVALGAIA